MHGDDELAALLGPQPASLPLPLPQISVCETDALDVLPRLRPHAMERAEEPFNLEPSMIIDVRQSARVFEVYHKLDERWRANTTQQALGTHVKAQEHSTPSATFASEERFLYFARRLNLNFQGIAELANLTDRQTRDALRIGTHYKPVFFTELTRVCLALVEMLAEELEDGEAGARKNPQRNAAYFKDCVEVFLSDLKVCVVSLNDVVERAYLMKLAHMAQLRALDTRYRDAFASAGAIARSAHRQSLRSWAKSVVDTLMAWADRLSPLVVVLRAHIMRLAAFVQGTLNLLHYHELHAQERAVNEAHSDAKRDGQSDAKSDGQGLPLETLRQSSRQWAGFMGAVAELARATNGREPAAVGQVQDCVEALQAALLQENPNPSEASTDAFLSMRFFLSGKSLVQPVEALTSKIAAACKKLNPGLTQYKRDTARLFERYSAETSKQERLVADLEKAMRVCLDESSFHSSQASRMRLFSQGAIDLNIALMSRIESLKPALARETATLKDLRDSQSVMSDLHKSCQDTLPVAQFDKFLHLEKSLLQELGALSAHVEAGYRLVNAHALSDAKAANATLFADAGRDSHSLASERDNVLQAHVLQVLHTRLNGSLPKLKELMKHIQQLCRHFGSGFLQAQTSLAEVNLDAVIATDCALRLNMIVASHIHEYASMVSRAHG